MLTATKQSKTGYWIEAIRKNLYSVEEINYFLYNHIDLVYRDFFCEELFSYIEKELEQPEMAEDLRSIAIKNGSTADFVKYILGGSYYYNSRELSDVSALVAGIDNMSKAARVRVQADSFYKTGRLNSALKCYLDILKNYSEKEEPNSFYARAAYAAGTIYARLFMSKNANTFFAYAYELFPDPVYAKACVYMSILADDDEELLSSIVKFKVSDDSLDAIKGRIKSIRHEIEASQDLKEFEQSLKAPGFAQSMVDAWKMEYENMQK